MTRIDAQIALPIALVRPRPALARAAGLALAAAGICGVGAGSAEAGVRVGVVVPAPEVVVEQVINGPTRPIYDADWRLRNAQCDLWQRQSDLDAARAHEAAAADAMADQKGALDDLNQKAADIASQMHDMQLALDRAGDELADRGARLDAIHRRIDAAGAEVDGLKVAAEMSFKAGADYQRGLSDEREAGAAFDRESSRVIAGLSRSRRYLAAQNELRSALDAASALQSRQPPADPAAITDARKRVADLQADIGAQQDAAIDRDREARVARFNFHAARQRLDRLLEAFDQRALPATPGYTAALEHLHAEMSALAPAEDDVRRAQDQVAQVQADMDHAASDLAAVRRDLHAAERDAAALSDDLAAAEDATYEAEQAVAAAQDAVAEAMHDRDAALYAYQCGQLLPVDPCGFGVGMGFGFGFCREVVLAGPGYCARYFVHPASYWILHPAACEDRILFVDRLPLFAGIHAAERAHEGERLARLERVEKLVGPEQRRALAENLKVENARFDAERHERETAAHENRKPRLDLVAGHEALRAALDEKHPSGAHAPANEVGGPRVPAAISESFGHKPEPAMHRAARDGTARAPSNTPAHESRAAEPGPSHAAAAPRESSASAGGRTGRENTPGDPSASSTGQQTGHDRGSDSSSGARTGRGSHEGNPAESPSEPTGGHTGREKRADSPPAPSTGSAGDSGGRHSGHGSRDGNPAESPSEPTGGHTGRDSGSSSGSGHSGRDNSGDTGSSSSTGGRRGRGDSSQDPNASGASGGNANNSGNSGGRSR